MPVPPPESASFWQMFVQSFTTKVGLAIFGTGFLIGIIPGIVGLVRNLQPQPQADLGTSMAQAIQAMIPLMMLAAMMQMMMGMFRMPAAYWRYY